MSENREGTPGTANFELPPDQPENRPEDGEQRPDKALERAPARPEKSPQTAKQPALPAVPDDIPVADDAVIPTADDDKAQALADPHQAASDSDHIEPEWVDKAKTIVAQTQNDPYKQKHEMSKVKAEYIRKRFGKTIKTDEAAA